MSKLKLFKLSTSEEVISKVVKTEEDHYVLEKPRLCAMQQAQDDQGNITGNYLVLLPWMMYATDPSTKTERDVKLYFRSIAGEAVSIPAVMEQEYEATTSSIINGNS